MTREIKFRAWDKENGMVYEPAFVTMQAGRIGINQLIKGLPNPMQYTGLKDKNGKEIYEGDIVKVLDRDWSDFEKDKINTKVVFKDGCFQLETFYKSKYDNEFSYLKLYKEYGRDWFEIIGNIYENPELCH